MKAVKIFGLAACAAVFSVGESFADRYLDLEDATAIVRSSNAERRHCSGVYITERVLVTAAACFESGKSAYEIAEEARIVASHSRQDGVRVSHAMLFDGPGGGIVALRLAENPYANGVPELLRLPPEDFSLDFQPIVVGGFNSEDGGFNGGGMSSLEAESEFIELFQWYSHVGFSDGVLPGNMGGGVAAVGSDGSLVVVGLVYRGDAYGFASAIDIRPYAEQLNAFAGD